MGWKLADLFVEFSMKGVEQVGAAVASVGAAITSFGMSAFNASQEGQYFGTLVNELGRQFASLFLPVIEAATKVLEYLVRTFQGMSQEAFNTAGSFAAVAAGVALVGTAAGPIGILAGALGGLLVGTEQGRAALGELYTAFERIVSDVGPPLLAFFSRMGEIILKVVVPVIQYLAWWLNQVGEFLESLGLKADRATAKGGHRTLAPASSGGFDSAQQSYARLQSAGIKQGGPDYQRQIADNTTKMVGGIDRVKDSVDRNKPGVGR